mgnify:CR=1 FL=1
MRIASRPTLFNSATALTLQGCERPQYNRPMPIRTRFAFVGAGQMTEALVAGLVTSGTVAPECLSAGDPSPIRRDHLRTRYNIATFEDNRAALAGADLVCFCVEPQILDDVLRDVLPALSPHQLILSVAAGYPIARLAGIIGPSYGIVRGMPNTPSALGAGVTALSFSPGLPTADQQAAIRLFEAIGEVCVVEERLMDTVTGLSGSGPAYVFTMIEALADGGVLMGLPRQTAQLLAAQTVAGAARMVLEQGEHPGVLKDRVASPGGTTIAGLRRLEEGRLRATLIAAVEAATHRSHELGRSEHSHS